MSDAITSFIAIWETFTDDHGETFPLPRHWRFKVVVMTSAGAGEQDWRYCIGEAVEAMSRSRYPVAPDGVFAYVIGIAWKHLAGRQGDIDPSAMEPYAPRRVGEVAPIRARR